MDLSIKTLPGEAKTPDEAFEKLKVLAKIQEQLKEKESTEDLLLSEYQKLKSEEEALRDFSEEMKLLQHEKMVHVEELRLIHSDISAMESVIKTSQSEMVKLATNSKDLYLKHQRIVHEISKAQTELGLDLSSKFLNSSLDKQGITAEVFGTTQTPQISSGIVEDALAPSVGAMGSFESNNSVPEPPISAINDQVLPVPNFDALHGKLFPNANAAAALSFNLAATQNAFQAHLENFFKQQQRKLSGARSLVNPQPIPMQNAAMFGARNSMTSSGVLPNGSATGTPQQIIRQHPAPMKACLSCHQQIHRNAPICPLCKAKSRSQNPKKPKRRPDDM